MLWLCLLALSQVAHGLKENCKERPTQGPENAGPSRGQQMVECCKRGCCLPAAKLELGGRGVCNGHPMGVRRRQGVNATPASAALVQWYRCSSGEGLALLNLSAAAYQCCYGSCRRRGCHYGAAAYLVHRCRSMATSLLLATERGALPYRAALAASCAAAALYRQPPSATARRIALSGLRSPASRGSRGQVRQGASGQVRGSTKGLAAPLQGAQHHLRSTALLRPC